MTNQETGVPTATFFLTDTDKAILAQTDEEFEPHTWTDMKSIIG